MTRNTLFAIALASLSVCIAFGLIIGENVANLIALYWVILAIKNALDCCRKDGYHDSY